MKKYLAIFVSLMMLFSMNIYAAAEEEPEVAAEVSLMEENPEGTVSDEEAEASEEASAVEEEPVGPIEISTAEELKEIADRLSADYILTADIDLEGKEWIPLGTYIPSGDDTEEQVTPSQRYAFTGTFDGNGHTISNLVIRQPEGIALGLFGCIANTSVGNFTLENATVDGTVMAADAVGYSFHSMIYNVTLTNGSVTTHLSEISSEGMVGGIVGAGLGGRIIECSAQADIVVPDGTANAGIIGGGLEGTSVIDCMATGSVTAGNNCYGIGGISGCGFGAEEFINCKAVDVVLTAGENAMWIGSITGYAGGYEEQEYNTPVTVFTGCAAEHVTIIRSATEEDLVGGSFYSEEAEAVYGAPYDKPTVYIVEKC
ncbi:MAG: hypothetical protein J6T99_02755 [Oscillospiraceae bacterium]|nr:hypothetical protein [Oscillospiraceae bacterium]MBO7422293.1 hypothetical protein [Oscillospiraceae bacterium]